MQWLKFLFKLLFITNLVALVKIIMEMMTIFSLYSRIMLVVCTCKFKKKKKKMIERDAKCKIYQL